MIVKLLYIIDQLKKICRKCKSTLPIDSIKCTKCHNKELRLKHKLRISNEGDCSDCLGYGYNKLRKINLKEIRKHFKI